MWESVLSGSAAGASENVRARRDIRNGVAALVALVEIATVAGSTYAAFVVYHLTVRGGLPENISYGWICTGLAVTCGAICLIDKQYDFLGNEWNLRPAYRSVLALIFAFVLVLAFLFLTGNVGYYSRGTLLAQLAFALPVVAIVRTALWRAFDRAQNRGRWKLPGVLVLVFPGVDKPRPLLERLSSRQQAVRQIYYLESGSTDAQLRAILRDSRALQCESALLLFNSDGVNAVARAVNALSEMPVRIQLLPIGLLEFMHCSRIGHYGRTRVFEIASGPNCVADRLLKRSFDLVVATMAGLLLLSVMLIVAALIKLDSPGPVLFRQTRHGYNNKPIEVLKFRTMMVSNDREFRQARRDDPRVTRIGRILRRTNIDELPQLLNVIRGDMSIVGPRPHAVSHNEMYDGQIARMFGRHNVKPGITGWAQVNGLRGETDTFEKMRARVEHDLYYIDNWSFAFDLKIVLMTLFLRKSYENAC
jgi:Undecaprenyl-phosphate glucose phosphotransferase